MTLSGPFSGVTSLTMSRAVTMSSLLWGVNRKSWCHFTCVAVWGSFELILLGENVHHHRRSIAQKSPPCAIAMLPAGTPQKSRSANSPAATKDDQGGDRFPDRNGHAHPPFHPSPGRDHGSAPPTGRSRAAERPLHQPTARLQRPETRSGGTVQLAIARSCCFLLERRTLRG